MAKQVKSLVPVDEKHLKKSIGFNVTTKDGKTSGKIGAKSNYEATGTNELTGETYKIQPWRYCHLVELGVAPHYQPELNRMHPGSAPQPFLRPVADSSKQSTKAIIAETIKEELEKEVK
jgi:hypothetical protein